jgi:hypothetical protein
VDGAINATASQESGIRRIDNHIDIQSGDVGMDGVDSTGHWSLNGLLLPGDAPPEHRFPLRMVISKSKVAVVM